MSILMLIERRTRYISLRAATEEMKEPHRSVVARLSRFANQQKPDGERLLADLDERLGRHFDMEGKIRMFMDRGFSRTEAIAKAGLLDTPALRLPEHIRRKELGGRRENGGVWLSAGTLRELNGGGIFRVQDFIYKGGAELARIGISIGAVAETERALLNEGIRTIDNPPDKRAGQ